MILANRLDLVFLILSSIFIAATLSAEERAPKTTPLYNEKKLPEEIATIFISPEDHYLEMHIKDIDGHKFNEERQYNYIDIDKYLVLPGTHNIVVGYAYYTSAEKYSDRKKVYDELKTTITTKPGYMYELRQNHRRYASDPKEIRVSEYRPGEKYFDVYRRQVKEIKSQIEKLNPKEDSEKISDKYFELARRYQDLKEHNNAVEAYENAIKYNPKKLALYGMVVPSLIELKEYAKARDIIEKMRKYEKRGWIVDALYGEIYGGMNDYRKAIEHFDKAVNSAPLMNKDALRERMAYFYNKAGMKEEYRLTMIEVMRDREKKEGLYLQITKEIAELKKDKAQFSESERKTYSEARKRIMEKYGLDEDKLFEIVTTTLYKHEKEFGDKYIKEK